MIRTYQEIRRPWVDRVMSECKLRQAEACRNRLLDFPEYGIFDEPMADDTERLFRLSYMAEEGKQSMPLSKMRKTVLQQVRTELLYLSPREQQLIERMVAGDGETELDDPEDMGAGESLLKRLWCVLHIDEEEDTAFLSMQEPVRNIIVNNKMSREYMLMRMAVFHLNAVISSFLYLYGHVLAAMPVRMFEDLLRQNGITPDSTLIYRLFKGGFEYCYNAQHDMILLHPGLYDPSAAMRGSLGQPLDEEMISGEIFAGAMNEILPEERPSAENVRGILNGALQPEYDALEMTDDLRIMVKQGATLEDMRKVLYGCLAVAPTPSMELALRRLQLETVPWNGMTSAVLN